MASMGFDQFWADNKPEDSIVPQKKKLVKPSQTSSMSTPQGTSVVRGAPASTVQEAARRRLRKYQDVQNNPDNQNS